MWAARGQPTCSVLGLLKIVPGLCEMDKNCPCVVCLKWYEMNGLSFVELNRLIHYFNVLVQ